MDHHQPLDGIQRLDNLAAFRSTKILILALEPYMAASVPCRVENIVMDKLSRRPQPQAVDPLLLILIQRKPSRIAEFLVEYFVKTHDLGMSDQPRMEHVTARALFGKNDESTQFGLDPQPGKQALDVPVHLPNPGGSPACTLG